MTLGWGTCKSCSFRCAKDARNHRRHDFLTFKAHLCPLTETASIHVLIQAARDRLVVTPREAANKTRVHPFRQDRGHG
jgi:hypothetical protein